jgi:hypothetical protein
MMRTVDEVVASVMHLPPRLRARLSAMSAAHWSSTIRRRPPPRALVWTLLKFLLHTFQFTSCISVGKWEC